MTDQVDGNLITAAPGFEGGSPPLYDGGDPRGADAAQIEVDTQAIESGLVIPGQPDRLPDWKPWKEANGVNLTAAGAGQILLPQKPLLREDVEIEFITVSITGASVAATLAIYRGTLVDETMLIDFATVMLGNSPSRQRSQYDIALRLRENDQILIVIAGGVASAVAVARAEGRARQMAGSVHV